MKIRKYMPVILIVLASGIILVLSALLIGTPVKKVVKGGGENVPDTNPSIDSGDMLSLHNAYRAKANASPLSWSSTLAKGAQEWADYLRDNEGCAMRHPTSGEEKNRYLSGNSWGQNLMSATRGSAQMAVDGWGPSECPGYSPTAQGVQGTGHFTQMVWKDTREIGCAKASCDGSSIWVCNYSPAGNVRVGGGGDEFALYKRNVEKPC